MPSSNTFPNAQTLTSSALSQTDINTIMQQITCFIFGIVNMMPVSATLVMGSNQITVDSVQGISVGFQITDLPGYGLGPYGLLGYGTGGNIPPGTTVKSILGNVITMSENALASITETIFITDPTAGTQVRQSWPSNGAPGYGQNDNVSFIRCIEIDDWYNKVPEYGVTANDDVSAMLNIEKTRVWRAFWELRGPTSYERATLLKTAMQLQLIGDSLSPFNLYLVPSIGNPQRMPELYEGKWWERSDISMHFNEQVNDAIVTPTVASIPVVVSNLNGVQLNLDVE